MQLISPQNYPLAAPLLLKIDHHTALKTILSGVTPGFVYLDDPQNPRVAFAQFKHRTFISGAINVLDIKSFRNFMFNQVFDNCRTCEVPLFRLAASDPSSLAAAADALSAETPIVVDYHCYRYQITSPKNNVTIPDDFIIRDVSEKLISEVFKGKVELLDEMCSERTSIDAFLKHSFGVAAFHGNQLAGWCLSEYNHENCCEVGIATLPAFQRHGLARAMTQVFLNRAYHLGLDTVLWHCYQSNIASRRTALSAGFSLQKDQQVLELYTNPSTNSAVHGNIWFGKAQYQKALGWYEKALRECPPQVWIPWNAACAAAQVDQIDLAFSYLKLAVDLGLSDLDHLVQSEYLTPLKNDPRWGMIITTLSQDFPS